MIDILLNALVPIFVVMALGYLAGWIRDVDNKHVDELNALVMDFALPASLFVATASTSRTVLVAQWPLLVVLIVSMLALYALSYLMQRRLFGLGSSEASVQALTISTPSYAGAGLPLIAAMYGASDVIDVALGVAAGSIVVSPLTLAVLEANKASAGGEGNLGTILQAVGRSLRKPIVLAPVIGVVFSLLGIPLPEALRRSFQLIGQAAGGVALFLTGVILSAQRIELELERAERDALEERDASPVGRRLDPGASHGPGDRTGGDSAVRSALRLLRRPVQRALRPRVP